MTSKEYLVRANLALGLAPISDNIPVDMGPFKLAYSPNQVFFLHELGVAEPEWLIGQKRDRQFPVSRLYIDYSAEICDTEDPFIFADRELELLERLIRLFQPGEVSVRRHGLWIIEEGGHTRPALSWGGSLYQFKPIKPLDEGIYELPEYPLDDDVLNNFIEFINTHWGILNDIPDSLGLAMARFSSSYEKRDLADRLTDLVIALEALFGDSESDSIAYKVAMRCAGWLHAPGKKRHETFRFLKKRYSDRSKVFHGRGKDLSEQVVNELECIVRESLKKCLDCQVRENEVPHGSKLDELIMTRTVM